ncbi:MAG: hypothetical protein R3C68_19995, partial [Myxococcota bacterium]
EYIDGEPTDERSDIYSFGAMLYLMLVGDLPFTASSPHALLKKVLNDPVVPANRANPAIHANIAGLVDRCLAKKPSDRYANATELVGAIDILLHRLGIEEETCRVALLTNQEAYSSQLLTELAPRYLALGSEALQSGRRAEAVDDFDRVLSLDPTNEVVRQQLRRLARRRFFSKSVRLTLLGSVGAALLVGIIGTWLGRPASTAESLQASAQSPGAADSKPIPAANPRNVVIEVLGGATLFIDGQQVATQLDGIHSQPLTPGVHRIEVHNESGQHQTEIDVPKYGVLDTLRFDLRPPPALPKPDTSIAAKPAPKRARLVEKNIQIMAQPMARLFIDDSRAPYLAMDPVKKQKTDLLYFPFTVRLSHGKHRLRFTHANAKPLEIAIEVSDTEPTGDRIRVQLQPLPAKLVLQDKPGGLIEVRVDGASIGFRSDANASEPILVPLDRFMTLKKDVELLKEGYLPFRQQLRFAPGQTARLSAKLQEIP